MNSSAEKTRVTTIIPGIVEVVPDRQRPGWESPNIYVLGEDPITLIDAGYDREDTLNAIRQGIGGKKVERIILTHGHIDHAGGAWELRKEHGCEVCAHPDEEWAIDHRFPGNKIDRKLDSGEKIQAGEFTIEVILVPGHAQGHIALYIESHGILFPGDLVTGSGSTLVAPPEGSMSQYMKSLKLVRKMPLKMLLPGHGPIVNDPRKRISDLIEHRELREICIAKCLLEKPMDLKELVKAMYIGLIHPNLEMAAAGTAWAHLEKMIEDGSVTAEPQAEQNPFVKTFGLVPGVVDRVKKL